MRVFTATDETAAPGRELELMPLVKKNRSG